jgi:hypothetical protein
MIAGVPILVFVTPGMAQFTGNIFEGVGREISIAHDSGVSVSGVYFDGMWGADKGGVLLTGRTIPMSWRTEFTHTVVAAFGEFTVAVQAPVTANGGVGFDEVVNIAASVPVRAIG